MMLRIAYKDDLRTSEASMSGCRHVRSDDDSVSILKRFDSNDAPIRASPSRTSFLGHCLLFTSPLFRLRINFWSMLMYILQKMISIHYICNMFTRQTYFKHLADIDLRLKPWPFS